MTAKLRGWWASFRAVSTGGLQAMGGRWRRCVVCGHRVPAFLPWRGGWPAAPALMRELEMVGSDLDRFACPRCGANDRDRHLRLYLERSGLIGRFRSARILHFAPEPWLRSWLSALAPAEYVSADLHPTHPEVRRIDVQEIPFESGRFDVVIANHVLEHVDDLGVATAEIARVMAARGIAILQTPWCRGLATTVEDAGVVSPAARLQLYGQEDHVRLFGRDVYGRIAKGGLQANIMPHSSILADIDPDIYGVNPLEDLMLFVRS